MLLFGTFINHNFNILDSQLNFSNTQEPIAGHPNINIVVYFLQFTSGL